MFCGRSSMVEHQLPKLNTRVRFPSPAPRRGEPLWFVAFFCAKCGFTVRVAAPLREKSRSARLLGCKRPRLRLAVATNFSRLKGIVLWVSISSPQPSGKLPLPRRGEPLWFAAFFCAKCGFTVRVGLTCRFGRCWTRPTGAQHRSSPRKVTLGSAARLQAPSLMV